MEDAQGPPASEGRVGVLPLVCEAVQRMTLFVARSLLLVRSTMPCLPEWRPRIQPSKRSASREKMLLSSELFP